MIDHGSLTPLLPTLLGAVMIGFFGSGHCLAMCSGIACAPSLSSNDPPRATSLALINGGRLLGYSLMGALAGWFGSGLASELTGMTVLRYVSALLLISLGLYIGRWWSGLAQIERLGKPLWKAISPLAAKLSVSSHPMALLAFGMLWGWLPCGLVYSALIWSMSSADSSNAALLMLFFGLGTLPAMLAAGLMALRLRQLLSRDLVRKCSGSLLVLLGVLALPPVRELFLSHH